MENYAESIIDSTKPNAGRIYDYFLGGDHYFQTDKMMADQLTEKAPFIPKLAILTRYFLSKGARIAIERGFNQFLDFASGLPTSNHIHKSVPAGTKIIYSDIDPITVQIGNEIIDSDGVNSYCKYVTCDTAKPEVLIESDLVKSFIEKNKKVAIGLNGVCWFLKNADLLHFFKTLYEWAAPGSIIFLTDMDMGNLSPEVDIISKMYGSMGQGGELRSKDKLIELAKPWKVSEPGLLLIEEWLNDAPFISNESIRTWGGGGIFGGILEK